MSEQLFRYFNLRMAPLTVLNPAAIWRSPQDVLEELREADPDGHALLTEHLVLPRCGDEQKGKP